MKKLFLATFAFLLVAQTAMAEAPAAVPSPIAAPTPAQQYNISDFPRAGFSDLAERLLPAVVNISTTQIIKDKGVEDGLPTMPQFPPGSPFEEFFKDFMEKQPGGGQAIPRQRKTTSLGSGFIIDGTGYVVTNNHVIEGADEINVIMHDKTNLKAKLVGRDSKTDLALLKVSSSKPLPFVSFGNSDEMKVGDWIVVIGNPFGLGGTVTQGIISARARDINSGPYDDYIQTDASINRGNSGGPMFNLKGDVIGINTAIFSPTGGSVGIGFAIPSSMARNVVEQLKAGGKIRRGWLGVRIQNMTEEIAKSLNLPDNAGALVSSLTPDSPAAKAGVQPGDVILTFDGKSVSEMRRLPRLVAEAGINKTVPITVWRDGKKIDLKVTVGEMKDEDEQAENDTSSDTGGEKPAVTKSLNIPELDAKFSALTAEARRMFKLPDDAKGIVLVSLGNDSPLVDKGLQPGDLIVEAAQKEIKEPKDLAAIAKESFTAKKPLLLLVDRGGDLRFVGVTPVEGKKKDEKK